MYQIWTEDNPSYGENLQDYNDRWDYYVEEETYCTQMEENDVLW